MTETPRFDNEDIALPIQETNAATNGHTAPDQRQLVRVSTDEDAVTKQVCKILAKSDTLFRRNGILCRVRSIDSGSELRQASKDDVRVSIAACCRLAKRQQKSKSYVLTTCPYWLPGAVMSVQAPIREVVGVLASPSLDFTGRLISKVGYDAPTKLFLAKTIPNLNIPDKPTWTDARRAGDELLGLVTDFPFADEADKTRWLTMLLATCCRNLVPCTPLGVITANVAGCGKTMLANLISIIAHGQHPYTSAWSDCHEETRKRLINAISAGKGLLLFDNIPKGLALGSAELDAFLTGPTFDDRQLSKNDGSMVGGINRCVVLATGNSVRLCADTADRTLPIRLVSDNPNPRSQNRDFCFPSLLEYASRERHVYLGNCFTILRAFIEEGMPQFPGATWGSFEAFTETIVSAVRWLNYPDPLSARISLLEDVDTEAMAYTSLLSVWEILAGDEDVSAGALINRIDNADSTIRDAAREALMALDSCSQWPPSLKKLSFVLQGLHNRVASIPSQNGNRQVRLIAKRDSHLKAWRFSIAETTAPPPSADAVPPF